MNCADSTASAADSEIQSLLAQCYQKSKDILREHRSLLDEIALFLLQKETITGDELMAYVNADAKRLTGETEASDEAEPAAQPEEQA